PGSRNVRPQTSMLRRPPRKTSSKNPEGRFMTTRSTHADANRTASIAQIVAATAEVLGQEITATAAEMIATDLVEYPDQMIADALKACRRELTGKLTLAAILDRAHAADGRPGRD